MSHPYLSNAILVDANNNKFNNANNNTTKKLNMETLNLMVEEKHIQHLHQQFRVDDSKHHHFEQKIKVDEFKSQNPCFKSETLNNQSNPGENKKIDNMKIQHSPSITSTPNTNKDSHWFGSPSSIGTDQNDEIFEDALSVSTPLTPHDEHFNHSFCSSPYGNTKHANEYTPHNIMFDSVDEEKYLSFTQPIQLYDKQTNNYDYPVTTNEFKSSTKPLTNTFTLSPNKRILTSVEETLMDFDEVEEDDERMIESDKRKSIASNNFFNKFKELPGYNNINYMNKNTNSSSNNNNLNRFQRSIPQLKRKFSQELKRRPSVTISGRRASTSSNSSNEPSPLVNSYLTFTKPTSNVHNQKYNTGMIGSPTPQPLSAFDQRYIPTRPAPTPLESRLNLTSTANSSSISITNLSSNSSNSNSNSNSFTNSNSQRSSILLPLDMDTTGNSSYTHTESPSSAGKKAGDISNKQNEGLNEMYWYKMDNITEDFNEDRFLNMFECYLSTKFDDN